MGIGFLTEKVHAACSHSPNTLPSRKAISRRRRANSAPQSPHIEHVRTRPHARPFPSRLFTANLTRLCARALAQRATLRFAFLDPLRVTVEPMSNLGQSQSCLAPPTPVSRTISVKNPRKNVTLDRLGEVGFQYLADNDFIKTGYRVDHDFWSAFVRCARRGASHCSGSGDAVLCIRFVGARGCVAPLVPVRHGGVTRGDA